MTKKKKELQWTATGIDTAEMLEEAGLLPSARTITKENIEIIFQPIIELEEGHLFANEAEVQCNLDEYPRIQRLFDKAKREGASGRLGRTIRDVIFERCPDERLFVKIYHDELIARWLVRPDDPICFFGHELNLMISESVAFEHYALCVGALKEICARTNANLVITDLGAGHSNLKCISDLSPSVVMLDRSLTQDLKKNKRHHVLVSQIVKLCIALDAKVVIVGLDTVEDLQAARDTGAHYGKGKLLTRPGKKKKLKIGKINIL